MAFVPVANTAQFELRYTAAGQDCANTLYFRRIGGWDGPGLSNACESLWGWWKTTLAPSVSNAVVLREVYGFDLSTADGPTGTYAGIPPASGGDTSPLLPNNVSIAVSFRTARRGRAYRGRNYFLGLTEGVVTNSTVAEARLTSIVSAYLALALEDDVIPGGTWVVCHRYSGRTPLTTGTAEPITDVVIVDPIVDSQRRRLPGRGK